MCKGFDWFRQLKLHTLLEPELMQLDSEQLTPDGLKQQLSSCLATDDETRLLQQLSSLPEVQIQSCADAVADLALDGSNPLQERCNSGSVSASSSRTNMPASSNGLQQPIAPPNDPLYLFRHVFSKPAPASCSSLETKTLDELRSHYKALVRGLSLYLMQHQTGGMAADDRPLEKTQAVLEEHLYLMAEMCVGRSDLVTALQLVSPWLCPSYLTCLT
jgi:hypothetical protein